MEHRQININRWLSIAIANFSVVAIAGVILRYKMNFPLAFLNQKNLLHGHSHFAFTGWITLALMTLMTGYLLKRGLQTNYRKYHLLLFANVITAYGMLFTFIVQGYGLFSITFSTLSIFVSYVFIYFYWRDLGKLNDGGDVHSWFKAALILLGISSAGAFTLAFLMAAQIKIQEYYFSAIYFFLHFQYNGWFIFASFGLLFSYLAAKDIYMLKKLSKKLWWILGISVAPTYLLSILWLKIPPYLYWTAAISGIFQLAAVIYLIRHYKVIKDCISSYGRATKYLWLLAFLCLILKIILQALSAIPYLGNFAFGLRPVVVAYLHLCFLGIVSFFIIGSIDRLLPQHHKLHELGVILFVSGVIAQEMLLMSQAVMIIMQSFIPQLNNLLFATAGIIGTGLILMVWKSISTKKPTADTTTVGL